jgi:hypothetical protein
MDLPQPTILRRLARPLPFGDIAKNMKELEAEHPNQLVYVRESSDGQFVEYSIEGKEARKSE